MKDGTTIHVVFGATGEYSDHREWPIIAFEGEDLAQEYVDKASARARELITEYDRYNIPDGANEWDPDMSIDYTGVNYYYIDVTVHSTVEPIKKEETE